MINKTALGHAARVLAKQECRDYSSLDERQKLYFQRSAAEIIETYLREHEFQIMENWE